MIFKLLVTSPLTSKVFQSEDEEPAVLLCETFKKLFDVILTP